MTPSKIERAEGGVDNREYDAQAFAFPFQPVTPDGSPNEPCMGMTLRDWFAGQAVNEIARSRRLQESWTWPMNEIAADAYAMADAMLAARGQGQ